MASSHDISIHGCLPLLYRILIFHSCRGDRTYWMRGNRYLSIHGWLQSWYGPSALHILCRIIREFPDITSHPFLSVPLTIIRTATCST
jgi:hypothetical protein